ncbi:hypothetical protein SAY87_008245 [Trapa incisa]|uniref:Uncharacterized protein n=1 Tax=Trapa incisa TaxID=236973 RepID=A0AAN7KCX7_9MYRT|nr:hypothetical protein SAY87_008245 [Trapa incisa]
MCSMGSWDSVQPIWAARVVATNSKIDRASFEIDRIVSFVAVSSSATMAEHQPQHLPEHLLTGPHDPPQQPPRSHCQAPVLVPAVIMVALLTMGFLASGGFGVAGGDGVVVDIRVLYWEAPSWSRTNRPREDEVQLANKAREMKERAQKFNIKLVKNVC